MVKNLEQVLRHLIERTNWAGYPHAREEVDAIMADMFSEKDPNVPDDSDNAPSGWNPGDDPVHTENGIRVYAVKTADGTGIEYVAADDNGWRPGTYKTIDAAVKGSDTTPAKTTTTRKR